MRYHRCQVYGIEYLQVFEESQQLYGSVTLVLRTALLDGYDLPPTTSRGFLSILTVDFPSLLRSSVNLTFGRR